VIFFVFILSFILILPGLPLNGINLNYSGTLQLLTLNMNQLLPRQISILLFSNTFVAANPITAVPINRALMALFYIMGIGFPVLHLIFLALLWFVPLPVTVQGMIFSLTEIISAWSALEVLIISVLVLVNNIQVVANFVTGLACVALNNNGVVPQAQCLAVTGKADVGMVLALVGALLYVIAANIILRVGAYVISFRIRGGVETERRKVAPDDSFGSDPEYGTPPEESYESAQSYSFGNTNQSRSSRLYR